MNEQEMGKEIARLLDFGASETIKQSTLYRLQSARRAALENCQPTLEIINSGNGTSVYGGHDEHFNTGKLLLLLIALLTFAVVSTTYWQFLEKGKSTTMLVDDLSTEAYIDNEPELADDLSLDGYIDNVRQLVDDLSTDAQIDSESEQVDDISIDASIDNEPELIDDIPTDTPIDNESELADDLLTDDRTNVELNEWLDSNK
ncbi:uncharacterized protein DUF3619 [Nitrosomonas sp. Nm84]|uniref:DUF3619 family protein n=1 Tax=Nitrosomonas sp. Nm84 TaxID=200124 RepID=UPI000D759481|nr:DUF3619 family protein [Nitrosomonas sp. Nm84]PXW87592.1 uncharacterized protein DUF3619 [Nitrosomonas sp. Nm84]